MCLWLGAWPFWAVLPLAVLAGAVFGAGWAFIPAYLQARRGSHIVITTIMFNFIAAALMTWLLVNVLIKPGQQSPESREFASNATLPGLHTLLGKVGISFTSTPLNLAFLFALAAGVLVWVLLWRTRWGYALRVAGQNSAAAVYAGIRPPRITIQAMLLSGRARPARSGSTSSWARSTASCWISPEARGSSASPSALMGRNHPGGDFLLAAVLFGALMQGVARSSRSTCRA